jgi:hypothetical protein
VRAYHLWYKQENVIPIAPILKVYQCISCTTQHSYLSNDFGEEDGEEESMKGKAQEESKVHW